MSTSKTLADSVLINADSRVIVFGLRSKNSLYHFVYVDHLGVLALREKQVEIAMTDLECLFKNGGLSLHERSVGSGKQETLGPRLIAIGTRRRCSANNLGGCIKLLAPC